MPSPPLLAESHRFSMIFLLSSSCCSSLKWKKGKKKTDRRGPLREEVQEEGRSRGEGEGWKEGGAFRRFLRPPGLAHNDPEPKRAWRRGRSSGGAVQRRGGEAEGRSSGGPVWRTGAPAEGAVRVGQDSVALVLRFLKLRPRDVDVLAQQGFPEFAIWKYIVWHLTDHEGLFFRS